MKGSLLGVAALAVGVAIAAAPAAHADIIGQLTVANANLATQGAGPYAQYDISGVGGGTTFTQFEVTVTGENGFVFGDHFIVDLNVSSGAGTIALFSSSISPFSFGGSGNVDGFGTFSATFDDGPGFSSGGYSTITFDFTTSNALSLANLLTTNSRGASVGGHLALATNTACTGFAANGGSSSSPNDDPTDCTAQHNVPEPSTLALLGAGLLGLAMAARRKKSVTIIRG